MSDTPALDLAKFPLKRMKPSDLIPAINPRRNLKHELLLPAILSEDGQITEPLTAWIPEKDDPILQIVTLLKGQAILVKGGRRRECLLDIGNNPGKYTATTVRNASLCPVILLTGISEEKARNLAMDWQDQEPLSRTDFITDVFRRLEDGHSWRKIAADITKGLYTTLLSHGAEGKYRAMMKIDDGSERQKKREADLRNPLDQWIFSAHLLGSAVKAAVLSSLKKASNEDLAEGERVLFNADQQVLKALRSTYSNATKGKDGSETVHTFPFTPITEISTTEEGVPLVSGGTIEGIVVDGKVDSGKVNNSVVDKLKDVMIDFHLTPAERNQGKPSLPKAVDRNNRKDSARSECGKLYAAFMCGLPSEGLLQADEAAFNREVKEEALTKLHSELPGPVGELLKVTVESRNIDKIVDAWKQHSTAMDLLNNRVRDLTAEKGKKPSK